MSRRSGRRRSGANEVTQSPWQRIRNPYPPLEVLSPGQVEMIHDRALQILEKEGINVEIVDLRSLRPIDEETVYQSVRKTNRCVVVDESWPIASVGAYVAWLVSRNCFDLLDAPVELVTSEDVPMPYNHRLELAVQPSAEKVIKAVNKVLYRE